MSESLNLNLIAGPQLIGAFFNWALLGVLNIQVYLYHTYFPKDRWPFKLMVYGILAFEWVHTGLVTSGCMDIYVYNYGNVESLVSLHNSWFAVPVMCAIVSVFVQMFFAWRIYKFSNSYLLAGGVATLSLTQGISALVAGGMMEPLKAAQDIAHGSIFPAILVWLSVTAAADIIIAILMTVLLLKSKNGLPRTEALINRMIQLVVETGMLTAGCAVIMLVLAKAPQTKNTLLYEALSLTITKVYANTFLTNLNSRAHMQEGLPKVSLNRRGMESSNAATSRGTISAVSHPISGSYELPSYHKGYEVNSFNEQKSEGDVLAIA
ncbi:uncharacterized protein B0H18DRAFT_1021214 [Fomitopsis serialis]|uniref:uncharacterized protein n=1 Tax=Fomitopsis serialis TaxID=139415 RepID=UPI002008CA3E|nr:uncharacterized protein B0H18DRAFT_1021214 [Neoantrodia serialis]KAH9921461.1 hypothetical protein B0H18DRAFT_1021214 [Neoantrodia serialis]